MTNIGKQKKSLIIAISLVLTTLLSLGLGLYWVIYVRVIDTSNMAQPLVVYQKNLPVKYFDVEVNIPQIVKLGRKIEMPKYSDQSNIFANGQFIEIIFSVKNLSNSPIKLNPFPTLMSQDTLISTSIYSGDISYALNHPTQTINYNPVLPQETRVNSFIYDIPNYIDKLELAIPTGSFLSNKQVVVLLDSIR